MRAVETSTQNVNHHLENLREADLVEVVDTWYSEKGAGMDVSASAADPLCVFVGEPGDRPVSAAVTESTTSSRISD